MSSVNLQSALLSGPRTARELASALCVSQPTVSRWLAEQRDHILVIGKARATRYALRRAVREIGSEWPVYRVDEVGEVSLAGRLHAIYPAGFVWRDAVNHRESLFEGLPWFLVDNRPQGFMGCQVVGLYKTHDLPERLEYWGDDDVLVGLTRFGHELPGNFLIGDYVRMSYCFLNEAIREAVSEDNLISLKDLRGQYPLEVGKSQSREGIRSSAGGEQPKLGEIVCVSDLQCCELLIKYSPVCTMSSGLRWSDLLVAEHLALAVLTDYNVAGALSQIFKLAGRTFLEVIRFDRTPHFGRRGIVSLEAVSNEFIGHSGAWDEQAASLLEQRLISREDYERILCIHAFGSLIANTDMHNGNLSFFLGDDFSLRLAPVYDMLPMHHAPNNHGEVIARPLRQARPTRLTEPVWEGVKAWAVEYWRRVRDDDRISADFQGIAAQYLHALEA
ncbi:MAG: type II toxin-antitoxin system HipA family toxin YjjJ [Fluviicoccus sp.]|uniref:type II toxin-antitoxin system HipA family toxin YjjJ n=1 Tax=Fluviicoccus sp. TaxID=2003552 RepID=UPI002715870C|nr:type II toxin-antitoxin system HipA family toxin YjjJ [Fluviicoccus sp.]MDO8331516.1 type II toxin-antitoxin system HipA family toxin YjjJ [Fluviicoccus sp.]